MHHAERPEKFRPYCIAYGASPYVYVCVCGFQEIPLSVSQFIESIFFSSVHFFFPKSILRHFNHFFFYFALILAFFLFNTTLSFSLSCLFIFYPCSKMIYELCVRPFHLLWLWSTVSNNVSFDGISFMFVCGTEPLFCINMPSQAHSIQVKNSICLNDSKENENYHEIFREPKS